MSRAVMQQALAFIERHSKHWNGSGEHPQTVVESIRLELAKPEQEPRCWLTPDGAGWRLRFSPPIRDTAMGWVALYEAQVVALLSELTKPGQENTIAACQLQHYHAMHPWSTKEINHDRP